jgi:xanthine dehydrogenase accessory factor
VEYDTRGSDDLVWGIGLGCEGAMQILLTRLDRDNDYQPFAYLQRCRNAHLAGGFGFVIESSNPQYPVGGSFQGSSPDLPAQVIGALYAARGSHIVKAADAAFLVVPVDLPIRLLVLGAGPDAMPLVEIAGLLGWHVSVFDHRPAYAATERFPRALEVRCQAVTTLAESLAAKPFDAAVVMSHHLPSDAGYLSALATSELRYVGLLGPAPRRQRLLSDIGPLAAQLAPRLHGPVGLDIGANTPETIALAIVSEVQAALAGRPGGSFSAGR